MCTELQIDSAWYRQTSENVDDGDKPKTQNIQRMNWLEIIGDDDTPFWVLFLLWSLKVDARSRHGVVHSWSREIFGLRISFVIHNQTLIIMEGSPVCRHNKKRFQETENCLIWFFRACSSLLETFPSGSRAEGNSNFLHYLDENFLRFLVVVCFLCATTTENENHRCGIHN
jgi:hypothetical protein